MSDVLCIYYSRTGNTRRCMREIADALGAEIVAVGDNVDRSGWSGYMRSGMEAMRKSTRPIRALVTEKNLEDYKLIIIGTPVWAGRCASPIRALLKRRGLEMERVAYVLTRSSNHRYEAIYSQMDQYTKCDHLFAVSLLPGSEGYNFWRDQLIGDARRYLEQGNVGQAGTN